MLTDRIAAQARINPEKPALIHNGAICSYAQFAARIAAALGHLSTLRLQPGSVAALCMASLAEAWIWGIAVRRLGLPTIVVEDAAQLAQAPVRDIGCVLSVAGETHPGLNEWLAARRISGIGLPKSATLAGTPGLSMPDSGMRPAGHIQLTSGTTGISKQITRDALGEERIIVEQAGPYEVSADSMVYLRDIPLGTAGGFRWPLLTWLHGGTVVFQQWHDFHLPHLRHDLTHFFATPAMLSSLMALYGGELKHDPRVRLLVAAGALPRALAAAIRERWGWRISVLLGSTEAKTISITPIDDLDELNWHIIFPWREVQVVDDADQPLAPGQTGRVRIRIDDDVRGYRDDPASSAEYFRDGYFYPGDLGQFDARGRLALHGRVTDVINVQGAKIASAPLERDVQDRLGAQAVCIFTMTNHAGDEELHVVVQPLRSIANAELDQIARFNLPTSFSRTNFHFVTDMPRNAMGKVLRQELKAIILQQAGKTGAG